MFPSLKMTTGMQPWIYARVKFFTGPFSHSWSLLPSAEWSGNQTKLKQFSTISTHLLHTQVHQNVHISDAFLTAIMYIHKLIEGLVWHP